MKHEIINKLTYSKRFQRAVRTRPPVKIYRKTKLQLKTGLPLLGANFEPHIQFGNLTLSQIRTKTCTTIYVSTSRDGSNSLTLLIKVFWTTKEESGIAYEGNRK